MSMMSDKMMKFILDENKKLTVSTYETGYLNGRVNAVALLRSRGVISTEDAVAALETLDVAGRDFICSMEQRYDIVDGYTDDHPQESVSDILEFVSRQDSFETDIRHQYERMKAESDRFLRGLKQ